MCDEKIDCNDCCGNGYECSRYIFNGTELTYIPWTFDDFNSNCEVIETAEVQPVEPSTVAVDIAVDVEAGELGW